MLFFSLNRFYFPSRLFLKMARKPRLYYPGALYHGMLRGYGGQNIFFSPPTIDHFIHLLQEGYQRFDHRIHAFCLMSNHVHPCSPPLSGRILHQVARVYQLEEKELRRAGQSRKLSEARAMIGMLAFDWKSATMREVGKVFNRDDSTISFGVHRLRQRLKESEALQNQLEELKRQILA